MLAPSALVGPESRGPPWAIDVIEQAISDFLTAHHRATGARHEKLASINHSYGSTPPPSTAITAFEKGTLDDEDPDIQARLTNLRKQSNSYEPTRPAWNSIANSR